MIVPRDCGETRDAVPVIVARCDITQPRPRRAVQRSELVDLRVHIAEPAALLRDQLREPRPQWRRETRAADTAVHHRGTAYVVAPVKAGKVGARRIGNVGNVASAVIRRDRILIRRLAEQLALAAATGSCRIIPCALGHAANVVTRPVVHSVELASANRGHVRVRRHLAHVAGRSDRACSPIQDQTRRAPVARGYEDRLPLGGSLREGRVERAGIK